MKGKHILINGIFCFMSKTVFAGLVCILLAVGCSPSENALERVESGGDSITATSEENTADGVLSPENERGPVNTPYPGLVLPKSAGSSIDVTVDTAQNLVPNVLISGCLQASNITFAGNSAQIGRFDRASDNPDFPLESEFIIATGPVTAAEGPNDAGNTTT